MALRIEDYTKPELEKMYDEYLKDKSVKNHLEVDDWVKAVFGKDAEIPGKEDKEPVKDKELREDLHNPDEEKGKKGLRAKLKSAGSWLKKKATSFPKDLWQKTKYQMKSMKNAPRNIGRLMMGKKLTKEEKRQLKTAATTTAYLALSAAGIGLLSNSPFLVKGINSIAKIALSHLTPGGSVFMKAAYFNKYAEEGDKEINALLQAVMLALGEHLEKMSDEDLETILAEAKGKGKEPKKKRIRIQKKSSALSAERVAQKWLNKKAVEIGMLRRR